MKQFQSEDERTRLRTIVQKIKPDGAGIIVRTASENVPDEKIIADIDFLVKLWESLRVKSLKSKSPSLVHEDLDLVFRATRDLISRDLDRIVIDDKKRYEDLVRFLNRVMQLGQADVLKPAAIVQNIDIAQLAQQSRLSFKPLIVEQVSDTSDGLLRQWPMPSAGVEKHRAYAFQWYALSAMACLFFVVTGIRRGKHKVSDTKPHHSTTDHATTR